LGQRLSATTGASIGKMAEPVNDNEMEVHRIQAT
jgi:hypothetical protein